MNSLHVTYTQGMGVHLCYRKRNFVVGTINRLELFSDVCVDLRIFRQQQHLNKCIIVAGKQ